MTVAFEEVTGGEQRRGTGSKVDGTEFGQQTPPLCPSPTSVRQASASLQHNVEDDVSNGDNATGGPVSRVQG